MLRFLAITLTVLVVKSGIITDESNMGFSYSDTTRGSNADSCGYAIGGAAQRVPSVGATVTAEQLLPIRFLALDVCQQDNFAIDNLQQLDSSNLYQCVEGDTELDRLIYSEQGAIGDCRNDERLDFTEEDVDTDFRCGNSCAAEIEFEEFAGIDSNGACEGANDEPTKPDRDYRVRVALDTCIPVTTESSAGMTTTDSYQYRCGLDSNGNPCNSESSDDCTSSIALYKFSGVDDCSGSASFVIGFTTDSNAVCNAAPNGIPFRYYRVEVDCPIQ